MCMLFVQMPEEGLLLPADEEIIAEHLDLDLWRAHLLITGMLALTDDGSLVPQSELPEGTVASEVTIGTAAVKKLLAAEGIALEDICEPLRAVIMPYEVLRQCTPEQWYYLSVLFVTVESRVSRCERMLSLPDLPAIIVCNEYRMLWEAVVKLDTNSYRDIDQVDDRALPDFSLSSIGYSVRDGWSEEMRARFAEEDGEEQD